MIGSLRGRLAAKKASVVIVECGGVGYEVRIPLSTFYEVQKLAPGATASLFIHTHVREDQLQLFGFGGEDRPTPASEDPDV